MSCLRAIHGTQSTHTYLPSQSTEQNAPFRCIGSLLWNCYAIHPANEQKNTYSRGRVSSTVVDKQRRAAASPPLHRSTLRPSSQQSSATGRVHRVELLHRNWCHLVRARGITSGQDPGPSVSRSWPHHLRGIRVWILSPTSGSNTISPIATVDILVVQRPPVVSHLPV
jgi:hypothetical protein